MNETISRIEPSSWLFQNELIRKMIWLQNVMFSFIVVICKRAHTGSYSAAVKGQNAEELCKL